MAALALSDSRGGSAGQQAANDSAASPEATKDAADNGNAKSDAKAAAVAAQNVTQSAQSGRGPGAAMDVQDALTELTLSEPYDNAWLRVGIALDRSNFTVDDRDRTRGLYFIRYVDPKDLSSEEQGFWSQVFHGHKEKVAKVYRVNVRAITQDQTRVAVVDDKGAIDSSAPAKQIMALLVDQLR
jgi:outer membrane protein assembly factor BamC